MICCSPMRRIQLGTDAIPNRLPICAADRHRQSAPIQPRRSSCATCTTTLYTKKILHNDPKDIYTDRPFTLPSVLFVYIEHCQSSCIPASGVYSGSWTPFPFPLKLAARFLDPFVFGPCATAKRRIGAKYSSLEVVLSLMG